MSDHNYATKFNATKIKLVPIYTMSSILQELLETKYNCEQKAVLAIVAMSITTTRPNSTLQNQTSADLYLWIMSSIPASTVRNEI